MSGGDAKTRRIARPEMEPLFEDEFRELVARLNGRIAGDPKITRGPAACDLQATKRTKRVTWAVVGWGRTDGIFAYSDAARPRWGLHAAEVVIPHAGVGWASAVEVMRRHALLELWVELWNDAMKARPFKFSYASNGTPPGYVCTDCGVTGVKLWREYQTVLDNQMLRCAVCAVKNQSASVKSDTVIGDDGKHESEYGRIDQIGSLVPAVPTEENDTFWGYSSVPQSGCDWWYGLPTQPVPPKDAP